MFCLFGVYSLMKSFFACIIIYYYNYFIHLFQSEFDAPLFELFGLENEIKLALRELGDWVRPQSVQKNLLTLMDDVYIQSEPLGVVLIIGAWNYPWALTLGPLIGAIAAGIPLGI